MNEMWDKEALENHVKAAHMLARINDAAFDFIAATPHVTEHNVRQFILDQFKQHGIVSDKDAPIVAFNENAAIPHYFAPEQSKMIERNTLVLIDIWGRLDKENAPFADMTWVGYRGTIPDEVARVFSAVIEARNACLDLLRTQLQNGHIPRGMAVDAIATAVIARHGYDDHILHRTGHSIGHTAVHGPYHHINPTNSDALLTNVAYTIEPGIYIPNQFGIRSEIDFYISDTRQLIVTTPVQENLVMIRGYSSTRK